jgi:hypothetical protein
MNYSSLIVKSIFSSNERAFSLDMQTIEDIQYLLNKERYEVSKIKSILER